MAEPIEINGNTWGHRSLVVLPPTDFKRQKMAISKSWHMSGILFFDFLRSKTDMLHLVDIANSPGRVGEQSGVDIGYWMKFCQ